MVPDRSESLLAGRRAIDGLPGVDLLTDCEWYEPIEKWALRLRITIDELDADNLRRTEWYAVVDPSYPWGSVKFHPARVGGISSTYPHQNLNTPGNTALPWRDGDVCLITPLRQWGGGADAQEPFAPGIRLRWHVERLREWIVAAVRGTLSQAGDPFEMPAFPYAREADTIVYAEGPDTFTSWGGAAGSIGMCRTRECSTSREVRAVAAWTTMDGEVIHETAWGSALGPPVDKPQVFWLMLSAVPIHSDWSPPLTWGELRFVASAQGFDLDALIRPIAMAALDRQRALLLIGFPIPIRVGGQSSEVAWQAILLPEVHSKGKAVNGFRSSPSSLWTAYRWSAVGDSSRIVWLPSRNWHPQRLGARGQLSDDLCSAHVAIVGVGALGSVVAELLARGGVRSLTLIDGECLEAGNLARHMLGVGSISADKATSVAALAASANPFVQVRAIPRAFEIGDPEALEAVEAADCVVDCTGSDIALAALCSVGTTARGRLWLSASLGYGADSAYVFAGPPAQFGVGAFLEQGAVWHDEQSAALAADGVIFEGTGCWHPAFPGRNDDIRLLAGTIPRLMENLMVSAPSETLGFIGRVQKTTDAGLSLVIEQTGATS